MKTRVILAIILFLGFNIYVLHKQNKLDSVLKALYLKDMYNDVCLSFNKIGESKSGVTHKDPPLLKKNIDDSVPIPALYCNDGDNIGQDPTNMANPTTEINKITTNSDVVYNEQDYTKGIDETKDFYAEQEAMLQELFDSSQIFDKDSEFDTESKVNNDSKMDYIDTMRQSYQVPQREQFA